MFGNVIIAVALVILVLEIPATATFDNQKGCVFNCFKNSERPRDTSDQCKACNCDIGRWCKQCFGTYEPSTTRRHNITTVAPPKTAGGLTSGKSGDDSLGLAIGLLLVGIVIGVIVTSLLCVCVPTLNKKATTIIMRNRTSRGDGKQETMGLDPQVRHTALRNANDSRDSNMYNVIQLDIPSASHGPIALGHANSKNPAQSLQAIQSLEYNVVAYEIIESSSPYEEPTYQSLNERTMERAAFNVGPLQLSGYSSNTQNQERAEITVSAQISATADRNYFKLEHGSTSVSDMESREQEDGDSSAYFVLEKNYGNSKSSRGLLDVPHSEATNG